MGISRSRVRKPEKRKKNENKNRQQLIRLCNEGATFTSIAKTPPGIQKIGAVLILDYGMKLIYISGN